MSDLGFNNKPFGFSTYEAAATNQSQFNTYGDYQLDWPWESYAGTTITDVINYYANLLILQYVGKPKAYATIQADAAPVVMGLLPNQVMNAYNLDTAVGVQLDVLGKYVGVNRSGYGPSGFITLDDTDYRTFIRLGIARNTLGSSLYVIQNFLHQFFEGDIFVFDNKDMQLSYYLNSDDISIELAYLFINEGLLPKPLGVQLASVIYAPIDTLDSFFGCCTYNHAAVNASPLNTYSSYQTDFPFLSYKYALQVT